MEKDIIYIAGDPDGYPLEYYDRGTRSYQGVVPELLRRFSEQSRYDVRYYSPGERDQREALAANRQVDIISCPEDISAVRHRAGEDILLLEDGGDGQAVALCLLDVAPDGLAGDLRAFLSQVSQQELTGLVVQAAQDAPPPNRLLLQTVFGGLALAVALLAAALVCVTVSSRRRLKKLRQERETDPVTGIGNRAYLERCCRTYLNDRNRVLYTLFCFTFPANAGGGDGAAFPRHMAAVLQDSASDTDILARVSDNGFALLRLSPGERDSAEWLAAVLGRLRETWQEGGAAPKVTAGAYPLKADDRDWNEILLRGLRTAQTARRKGAEYQFFRDETLQAMREEQRLRADVRSGLQNREFQLYLQFYVYARTGRAAGAEVQLQWEHPERGPLPASHWFSLLEQEGLAGRLDSYVLERMCAFLDFLKRNGREDFFLLYRLSRETISSAGLEAEWRDILDGYRFERGQLLFGVPPGAVPRADSAGNAGVGAIRSMGMGLVLEGFDGQLVRLLQAADTRLCGLKLDQELTNQAGTPSGQVALKSILQAGHRLELAFLAENVVSEEQTECLRELGCDLLGGDLYAPPLPAWEAMKKLVGRAGKESVNL